MDTHIHSISSDSHIFLFLLLNMPEHMEDCWPKISCWGTLKGGEEWAIACINPCVHGSHLTTNVIVSGIQCVLLKLFDIKG